MKKIFKLSILAILVVIISSLAFAAPGRGGNRRNVGGRGHGIHNSRPSRPVNRPHISRPNSHNRPVRHYAPARRPRYSSPRYYRRRPVYYYNDYYYDYPYVYSDGYYRRHRYYGPAVNVNVGFPIGRHVYGGISVGL